MMPHSQIPHHYLQSSTIEPCNHCETETIGGLYAAHREVVFKLALRITRNPADAEDVVQTVFLRMMRNDSRPDPERPPQSYLRRAARNASIDLLRQRMQRAETGIPRDQRAPEDPHAERRYVQQVVNRLPPQNARLFELHYRDGYRYRELAGMLGMHTGTVKSRLHRLRATLQDELRAA